MRSAAREYDPRDSPPPLSYNLKPHTITTSVFFPTRVLQPLQPHRAAATGANCRYPPNFQPPPVARSAFVPLTDFQMYLCRTLHIVKPPLTPSALLVHHTTVVQTTSYLSIFFPHAPFGSHAAWFEKKKKSQKARLNLSNERRMQKMNRTHC